MLEKFNGNFICLSNINWISDFCFFFPFWFCLFKVLRSDWGRTPWAWFTHGSAHLASPPQKCMAAPLQSILMFWYSSFFFLVELFWLHKLGSPSSYLEYGVAYCKDTVHGDPGDSGHLSHWGSKNSGLRRWHQAALRTSAAEAGFCNSTFLVASFFSISRDLLFTSWLLFKYKLWSLRTPVKTSFSLPFLIIIS